MSKRGGTPRAGEPEAKRDGILAGAVAALGKTEILSPFSPKEREREDDAPQVRGLMINF
jgi:hypothetical protein